MRFCGVGFDLENKKFQNSFEAPICVDSFEAYEKFSKEAHGFYFLK